MIQGPNITHLGHNSPKLSPILKEGDSLQRLIGINGPNIKPQQVTLWSILTEEAWRELNNQGVLKCSVEHINSYYASSYDWMREQLKREVGPASKDSYYPIWAWYQYKSSEKPKPDLRCSGHLENGSRGVRVQIEVPNTRVLLSDFILWNLTFNDGYVPKSSDDDDKWDKLLKTIGYKNRHESGDLPERFKKALKKSWRRIFREINLPDFFPDKQSHLDKSIQACLWEIQLDEVVKFKQFKAR